MNNFKNLMSVNISSVSDVILQQAISYESSLISVRTKKTLSAKSIANAYGLIEAALKFIDPSNLFNVVLPKKHKEYVVLPEPEDVFKIIKGGRDCLWTVLEMR